MRRTRRDLPLLLLAALAAIGSTPSAMAATWEKRMTQGKLAADLGDQSSAEQVFADLAADGAAPDTVRAESLVRLGVVQRAAGKTQASGATFRSAMQSRARDAQVTRLLTLALAGVAPDRRRWASQWPKVRLASQPGVTEAHPFIEWPGPGPQGVREAFPVEDPVTFDLEDVPLVDFLQHLLAPRPTNDSGWRTTPDFESWPESYQPPAAVQRLGFVIHAAVGGFTDATAGTRVTVKASRMPWNELFENVLASNGLGFVIEKNLLFIARVEDLGAIERVRGRTYRGLPISLNFLRGRLEDVLRLFSDITGFRIVPDANLQGSATMIMTDRPAMQVLDVLLAACDLAATRIDAPLDGNSGATALRIQKLADVRGEAVDLSRLVAGPPATPTRAPAGFTPAAPSVSPLPASFALLEGAVQVKKLGALEWTAARQDMQLNQGDLVRTGSGAGAAIRFTNGINFRLRPDSCIIIDPERLAAPSAPSCP